MITDTTKYDTSTTIIRKKRLMRSGLTMPNMPGTTIMATAQMSKVTMSSTLRNASSGSQILTSTIMPVNVIASTLRLIYSA